MKFLQRILFSNNRSRLYSKWFFELSMVSMMLSVAGSMFLRWVLLSKVFDQSLKIFLTTKSLNGFLIWLQLAICKGEIYRTIGFKNRTIHHPRHTTPISWAIWGYSPPLELLKWTSLCNESNWESSHCFLVIQINDHCNNSSSHACNTDRIYSG